MAYLARVAEIDDERGTIQIIGRSLRGEVYFGFESTLRPLVVLIV
jgi:hypothetical protein